MLAGLFALAAITYTLLPRRRTPQIMEAMGQSMSGMIRAAIAEAPGVEQYLTDDDRLWLSLMEVDSEAY
jgi:hypothetical protein